jgi:hypothetical protein
VRANREFEPTIQRFPDDIFFSEIRRREVGSLLVRFGEIDLSVAVMGYSFLRLLFLACRGGNLAEARLTIHVSVVTRRERANRADVSFRK